MGTCEPGQGRKSAAISSLPQVRWVPHRGSTCKGVVVAAMSCGGAALLAIATTGRKFVVHSGVRPPDCDSTGDDLDRTTLAHDAQDDVKTMSGEDAKPSQPGSAAKDEYVVIARRYRPQEFGDLLGQEHVATALSNAISTNRVGHAYLFTGARGVGKTSAARIFAKALNCEQGPLPVPCNQCDICRSISSGDDIDVLEIDGASNRGIDEIRQLRQNVNVRPSRTRLKIYIIDEVHMLTREAFNALLKTLEEPPEHVKFIFCTTEPTKIPITILSRCQRFDFAGIEIGAIAQRLRQIVQTEGVEAETEALEVLARRAAGSMRDSQSLLEQLLAFAPGRIALDDVHGMLGTAGDRRLADLVGHLIDRNAAAVLADLDAAISSGVDASQLLEQLLGYFRDCMAAAVNCPPESFLYASSGSRQSVVEAGKRLGLTTVLAVLQILDQALARIRSSTQGRILAELALVRICLLEDLDEMSEVIARLQSGLPDLPAKRVPQPQPAVGAASREPVPRGAMASPPPAETSSEAARPGRPSIPLSEEAATEIWTEALAKLSGMVVEQAKQFERVSLVSPNRLAIRFKAGYAFARSLCERPENVRRFEQALSEVTGQPVSVSFAVGEEESGAAEAASAVRPPSTQEQLREVAEHPMIHRAGELFGARPLDVKSPKRE